MEEERSQGPEWLIQEGPMQVKVLFDDGKYAVLKPLSTAGHMQLDAQRDKMSNLEYAMAMVDRTVIEWTVTEWPDGEVLPLPIHVPRQDRNKRVWDHVPTRWAQRMAMGAAILNHPGGEGVGGRLASALEKDANSFEESV